MTFRNVLRREVTPTGTYWTDIYEDFDLRWAAWGAAVETLQIDLVAAGWMSLFDALLEPPPEAALRWRGAGPGTNAEIKRAYSALFGRFFGRAVLRRYHGCRWLRQVRDGLELAPGIQLRRRAGYDGDLPDWVGWDDHHGCIVVAEAKGSNARGNWHSINPPPIRTALAQLERVEIVDTFGSPVHFKTWAVACRWGTMANGIEPTIITCDPDTNGRALEPEEARQVRSEMQARWNADLLEGLGRPDVAQAARMANLDAGTVDLARDLTEIPGKKGYGALAIEAGGVIPLVGARRAARCQTTSRFTN
jgi:hypothetical protein